MLLYPLGSHFTTSLCGVHSYLCATSPHRHVDYKSCQDDAPKLLQPSSYAHIIKTTPLCCPYLSVFPLFPLNTWE